MQNNNQPKGENRIHTIKVENTFMVPALTLDCGQAFRWKETPDGGWHGVAYGKALTVKRENGSNLFVVDEIDDFEKIWKPYFDMGRDYNSICERLAEDESLSKAVRMYRGIVILRQEPWETLCSFIISQNNNIPRIKGIIDRLCTTLGEDLGNGDYSFPGPDRILEAGMPGLDPLRAGFRTKYIIDAARKVADGTVDFKYIDEAALPEAAEELKKIKGVGDKVAACTLLYGFGKVDALPIDVWVRRILDETYPDGLPCCTNGIQGIAQQYLFHWRRNNFAD